MNDSSQVKGSPKDVTLGAYILYALPQITVAMYWNPIFVMQGVYVKYFGFSMAAFSVVLLASRIFDAAFDPVIGTLSDWLKAKTGKRKPLLALGAVLFILAGLRLYAPPEDPSMTYIGFWLVAFFAGITVFMIPHLAWGGELAKSSHDKTRIFGYYTAAGCVGLVIFYSVPLLPFWETSSITPEVLRFSAIVAALIFVPVVISVLLFVPEGPYLHSDGKRPGLRSLLSVFGNQPFVLLVLAYSSVSIGLGAWYGMVFLFVDGYLQMGNYFAPIYLAAFATGIASSLLWTALSGRIGKKKTWSIAVGVGLAAVCATPFLTPENANVTIVAVILIGATTSQICFEFLPRSILGDVIDYATLKNGRNEGATYFSVFIFIIKAAFAVGGSVGLGLAGVMGYDPGATVQETAGVKALTVVMGVLPAVFLCAGIVLVWLIPIDERRHAIIRRRLDQQQARLEQAS